MHAADGWTDLVLGPDRPVRLIDGLITGWHDAGASHLLLLRQSPVLTWYHGVPRSGRAPIPLA